MPETDICQYWPEWFRKILDFQALCQTEGEELRGMAEAMDQVRQNLYVQTMDEGATAEWESIFRIVANPATESLEFRRDRVLNRLSMRPPFTLTYLYQRLDALFGPGNWEVEMDYPNATLYIEAAVEDQQYFSELSATMDIVKPCHIVYISRPRVSAVLLLSEEIALTKGRYNYSLGGWALGQLPFRSQDKEEIVKMAAQPSIQPALLDQTAAFVADDVQSVRINGTVLISALSHSSAGNVGTVGYTVLKTQVQEVTLIELLDVAGAVLASSPVYVPINEDKVAFRHRFTVKEGT
ncbi:MAG: DUF2313 domain-containing protein [Lawsonibacter sp.]|nr:DUF2313 domain-containing protein [Lawsonibacter sp.]